MVVPSAQAANGSGANEQCDVHFEQETVAVEKSTSEQADVGPAEQFAYSVAGDSVFDFAAVVVAVVVAAAAAVNCESVPAVGTANCEHVIGWNAPPVGLEKPCCVSAEAALFASVVEWLQSVGSEPFDAEWSAEQFAVESGAAKPVSNVAQLEAEQSAVEQFGLFDFERFAVE